MITYKHEYFIHEAIEGVLMQKVDFPVEFLIADDSSPDRTREIVDEYIQSHPNGNWIKYVRHSENKGMMGNFVWALENCKGKYIALCEGDDVWTDCNKLRYQVEYLRNNDKISLCFHDAVFLYENGSTRKFTQKYPFLKDKQHFGMNDLMDHKWFIPTASIVFRNTFIPAWINSVSAGDFSLHLILADKGIFLFIDKVMSKYRVHAGGASHLLRRPSLRMKDISIWYKNVSSINKVKLIRWYFSNFWRHHRDNIMVK